MNKFEEMLIDRIKEFSDKNKRDDIEHAEYMKERIEELESQYSMIWRIRIQLSKGTRTSKVDLDYVNEVHRQVKFGEF